MVVVSHLPQSGYENGQYLIGILKRLCSDQVGVWNYSQYEIHEDCVGVWLGDISPEVESYLRERFEFEMKVWNKIEEEGVVGCDYQDLVEFYNIKLK